MIAGVPGAGISAFFYLLCVLAMPFVASARAVRAGAMSAGRWRLVMRQLAIALGIAGGLLVGGAAITLLAASAAPPATAQQTAQLAWQIGSTFSRIGIGLGIATLVIVLGTVQLWVIVDALKTRRAGPGGPRRRQLVPVHYAAEEDRAGRAGAHHSSSAPRGGGAGHHSTNAPRD